MMLQEGPILQVESPPIAYSPSEKGSQSFVIEGGHRLYGVVNISGAKNAVLPIMAAALLTPEDCIIDNVPRIDDVQIMGEVLRSLGATVEWIGEKQMRINAAKITNFFPPSDLVKKMRGSFLVVGPLLARFGRAASCPPGGDIIGQRPIDVHLTGFEALGAAIGREEDVYVVEAPQLRGSNIFMDYPSHIGTENLLMACSLAQGKTVIKNTSQEPEVVDLARMLTKMGAKIQGAGSSRIEVEGVESLKGASHSLIPDRIEAGTFAIAAAIAGGEVILQNVICAHIDSLIWKLNEAGVEVAEGGSFLWLRRRGPISAVNVQALPYPGFATDLQAAIGVLLTQAQGKSIVHERVYENRLLYVKELRKMGARVEVNGQSQTAMITGPVRLRGGAVRAMDIRSGAALILAGLVARGATTVADIYHLDRGYESIDQKLRQLGAVIHRLGEEG